MPRKLRMLRHSTQYAHNRMYDPLRFYYWPILGPLYRRRVELCLDLLPGGTRILEVGFGSGVTFFNLAELYEEIWGIDLESDCGSVRQCFSRYGLTPRLINGSITSLPYDDASFDSVLCVSILEHLKPDDLWAACAGLARILRPGGNVIYGVPVERPLMVAVFRIMGYDIREHHFSTENDVAAAMGRFFSLEERRVLRGLGGASGPLYEACRFRKRESECHGAG